MTKEEIIRDYRQAKNRKRQIQILADRNRTTTQAIRELLREAGQPLPAPSPRAAAVFLAAQSCDPQPHTDVIPERSARFIELVEQGTPVAKIAEDFGISYGQAMTWVARLCVLCEEYIAAAEGGGSI